LPQPMSIISQWSLPACVISGINFRRRAKGERQKNSP
jgi:hypothetical protein